MGDNVENCYTWIETPSFVEELKEKDENIFLKINVLLKQEINKNSLLQERRNLSIEDVRIEFERQVFFLSSWEKCNANDFSEKYKNLQAMFKSCNNSDLPNVLKDSSYASINQSHERNQVNNFILNKKTKTSRKKDECEECMKNLTEKLKKFKLNTEENSITIHKTVNKKRKTRRGKRARKQEFKNMLFSSILNCSNKEEDKIFISKYQSIYIELCKASFEFNCVLKVHSSLTVLSKKIEKLIKQSDYQDLHYILIIIRLVFKNCTRELNSYIADMRENESRIRLCVDTYNQILQDERTKICHFQAQIKHGNLSKWDSVIDTIKEYYHKLTLQIEECELIIMELQVKKKDIVMEIAMLTGYICELKIRNEDVKTEKKINSDNVNALISHLTACNLVNDISATLKTKHIQTYRTV